MKRESGVEFTVNCDSEVPQDDERKGGSSSVFLKQTSSLNTMTTPLMTMIRRRWCRASTSKQRTWFPFHNTKNKKRENGEDIEQSSSLAVVLNQSKKN